MTEVLDKTGEAARRLTRLAKHVANGDPSWLGKFRAKAMARFDQVGFPTTSDEEWRQTNVAAIAKIPFLLPDSLPIDAAELFEQYTLGDEASAEIVFVNGLFSPRLSRLGELPRGVKVASLAQSLSGEGSRIEKHLGRVADMEKNPFVALSGAFARDGAFVHLPRGATVARPIHLLYLAAPGSEPIMSPPRTLILIDENVEATIVETYAGPAGDSSTAYFTNAVTEMIVGPDSRIDHCKLQQESLAAFHIATMAVSVARGANFVSHSASLGSKLTRNDLNVVMAGEFAQATLNGLTLIGGQQHVDNHTLLDHLSPNCPSHELYKHVLSDRSSGVFKGKILVRPGAQKTDSKQTSKTLLLSDDAIMHSQPMLEIYADDVKCTHGSTIGPVDEEMVFYLRSRGVGLEAARHLLTYAFAADITRRIKVEPVRRRLEEFMAAQHGLPIDLRITDLGRHDEASR